MRDVLAVFFLTACSWAGGLGDNLGVPKAPSVTVAPVPAIMAPPGKAAKVELDFHVTAGFHINSNQPRNDLLLPTTLKLDPPANILVRKISYPPGQDLTLSFMPNEPLNVYSGDFSVVAWLSPASSAPAGTYRVRGALKYQACDNRQCFPSKKVPVDFDVRVQKRSG